MASAFLVATAAEEDVSIVVLEGGMMRRTYFDARFLTMFAVLVVISVALGNLMREGSLDASHTTEKMLMVERTWFNGVVSRAIH